MQNTYSSAQLTTTVAVSTIGVFTNGILIVLILVDPLHKLKRGPWITIFSLSMADLTVSFSQVTRGVFMFFKMYSSKIFISTNTFFWTLACTGSLFHLVSLTIQTYIITKYPIRCLQMLSRKKTYIICATAWLVSLCFAISYLVAGPTELKNGQFLFILIMAVSLLVIVVVFQVMLKCLIIKEVMQSRRKTLENGNQHNNNHLEIAKTIFILNIFALVTIFPYFLSLQLLLVFMHRKIDVELLDNFHFYYLPVAMVNFAVNPIVYALRLVDYRSSLKAVFKKKRFVSPVQSKPQSLAFNNMALSH